MDREQRAALIKISVSAALLILAVVLTRLFDMPRLLKLALYLPAYLVAGFEVLKESAENIAHGEVFDEAFLMTVATVGAFCIGEYPEAVFVMLFFNVGEFFEELAEKKSRKSVESLMELRRETVRVERGGSVAEAPPEEVLIGDTIIVRPGERVPLDGVITEGGTDFDTSILTGEAMPLAAGVGSDASAGFVNLTGVIKMRVTKELADSAVSRILALIESAGECKAKTDSMITRFARYYTPAVVICAVILAFLPPIFAGDLAGWIKRALVFLVVSCPCALVASVPLAFFSGIGCASRHGVLIKGASHLETLASADTAIFDKTGTLTKGVFKVTELYPNGCTERMLLEAAAMAESYSSHPVAKSIRAAYDGKVDMTRIKDAREIAGRGVSVTVDGVRICAGNAGFMEDIGVLYQGDSYTGTTVHIAANGKYLGRLVISDELKEDAEEAVERLKRLGIGETVMLTGDTDAAAKDTAAKCGIDRVYAGLLPEDKLAALEEIISKKRSGRTVFIGDGINDAPAISRADVGVAMGALGSDAAIEAADVVIMDDSLIRVPAAVEIARRTKKTVLENIALALGVKGVVLALGALGIAPLWLAVFADVGVLILAVLNSVKILWISI
ncbi:MAG: cadmium-translocating P-type ATPase [Oscillospiraceae bacterium]|nr:cadmium-translocating P-type ATPase [Oscillospiraceae bacterium]